MEITHKRSRAAILPFPGDPLLLHYWLHFFDTVWGEEIDRLYIHINSPIEQPVIDYIKALCDERPKITYMYTDHQIEHGDAIDNILDLVSETDVMLIEDDGFIFTSGIVDQCFRQLESGNYDIVGSKRGSCATSILEAAQRKWGIGSTGEGDQGCNFWPNYFFSSVELLKSTDRNFKAVGWKRGDIVPGLDMLVEEDVIYGDTFVNTSLQLRAIVPIHRIQIVPQYHGHPSDLQHASEGKYLFDGFAPWTHIGSLSSGVGGILQDDQGRALARRLIDKPKGATQLNTDWCKTDQEREEWERRASFWLTFWEKRDPDQIPEFADMYHKAVMRLIQQYRLREKQIRFRQVAYKNLGL